MNLILQMRSNMNIHVSPESAKLIPFAELVFVTTNPQYEVSDDMERIEKIQEVSSVRVSASTEQLERLISDLTILRDSMRNLDEFTADLSKSGAISFGDKKEESDSTK